ncbi:hypothetical protein H6CHR_04924 [Variovorax sp. PBL-H6]|uniref:hypothetical protein n=1 Tax=Variovorax sp. PBL-H6 TaxID=434009 RepID=UPI001317BB4A|nr:hypothetical protein [Variovorax sp. PBL-H6]VTU37292.1 hypothetical protein H6CHR_04924 [Variovorax sp. PBL-H6]
MPSPISQAQFKKLRLLLGQGRVGVVYTYLADHGYYYACWAAGELDGGSPPELRLATVPGLCLETAQRLQDGELTQIRLAMACGYLDSLGLQFDTAPLITRDVTAEETAEFHGEVFRAHFLGLTDWSLRIPFEQQEKAGGLEAVERYWQGVLRTSAQLNARAIAKAAAALLAA